MPSKNKKALKADYLIWLSIYIVNMALIMAFIYLFLSVLTSLADNFMFTISLSISLIYFLIIQLHLKTYLYFLKLLHLNFPNLEFSLSLLNNGATNFVEQAQIGKIKNILTKITLIKILKTQLYLFGSLIISLIVLSFIEVQNINNTSSDDTNFRKIYDLSPDLKVSLTIVEPPYTKGKKIVSLEKSVQAKEFSTLIWHFDSKNSKTLDLRFLNGDTIHLSASKTYQLTLRKDLLFTFYYGENTLFKETELYQIENIPDSEAELSILLNQFNYTVDLRDSTYFNFKLHYKDDYGLSDLKIIATLGKGKGESIKFREKTLLVPGFKSTSSEATLAYKLNLTELGAGFGDELYFYALATDSRPEQANISRSNSYFINIKDTSSNKHSYEAGLVVDRLPEYFKSQRQIIIETEALIKNKTLTKLDTFLKRNNTLAYHQRLLRKRYGTFLGEEHVPDIDEGTLQLYSKETGIKLEAHFEGDGHNHGEKIDGKPLDNKAKAKSFLEDYSHTHDTEEQASYLDPKIKALLKELISEMWNAELYLRLSIPKQALPYETRALKIIKEVQQDARIYVERVGFETAKVNVAENRLKGDLENDFKLKNELKTEIKSNGPEIRLYLELINAIENTQAISNIQLQNLIKLENDIIKLSDKRTYLLLKEIKKLRSKELKEVSFNNLYKGLNLLNKDSLKYINPTKQNKTELSKQLKGYLK